MRKNGPSGSSWGSSWAPRRAGCWLLCLLCALGAPLSSAQSANPIEPPTLNQLLNEAAQNVTQLQQRLNERRQQVNELQQQLEEAKRKLADSEQISISSVERLEELGRQLTQLRQELEQSLTALRETQSSLAAQQTRYDELWTAWQAYQAEMQAQVRDSEWRAARSRIVAVIGWIVAGFAGLAALIF